MTVEGTQNLPGDVRPDAPPGSRKATRRQRRQKVPANRTSQGSFPKVMIEIQVRPAEVIGIDCHVKSPPDNV